MVNETRKSISEKECEKLGITLKDIGIGDTGFVNTKTGGNCSVMIENASGLSLALTNLKVRNILFDGCDVFETQVYRTNFDRFLSESEHYRKTI